jgi:type II secretory pathway component PulK
VPSDTSFRVRVTYTDRIRRADGRFRTFTTEVEVLAADDVEATQLAAQMVDAIRSGIDGMVTATEIVAVDGEPV